jgi:UDP-N-acetylmuramoyl-tripeptide--D-alanyl-D-alanine ligase
VVLGDHLELGKSSAEEHRKLGRLLGQKQLDGVFLIGPEMKNACNAVGDLLRLYTDDYQNLQPSIEKILKELKSGDALLVKGSRGMGLDRLVREIHNSSIGVTS